MVEAKAPRKIIKKTVSKTPQKVQKALYAVFATGGKQYRVGVGDKVKIEKLGNTYKEGDKIVFDKVLLVDDGSSETTVGTPFINGAEVNATLAKISRYKTVDVIKYKQKSRYFKKYGHRQPYFEVSIDSIK
jgi:large subunit ribosomal protein L21